MKLLCLCVIWSDRVKVRSSSLRKIALIICVLFSSESILTALANYLYLFNFLSLILYHFVRFMPQNRDNDLLM